jgi:hypothetical protein
MNFRDLASDTHTKQLDEGIGNTFVSVSAVRTLPVSVGNYFVALEQTIRICAVSACSPSNAWRQNCILWFLSPSNRRSEKAMRAKESRYD